MAPALAQAAMGAARSIGAPRSPRAGDTAGLSSDVAGRVFQSWLAGARRAAAWVQPAGSHGRKASGRLAAVRCAALSQERAVCGDEAVILQGRSAKRAQVVLFGMVHTTAQPHAAEYILKHHPARVVVETAVTVDMGECTGSELRAGDRVLGPPAQAFFVQMWYKIADELSKQAEPLHSELWEQLRAQYNGEHLAYIAAFAVGATLVYGDRPKRLTYHRMLNIPTVRDLDVAFGMQSAANYREIIDSRPPEPKRKGPVNHVLMVEREAVMCSSLSKAAKETGPDGIVVGVVGQGHLPGLQALWKAGDWQDLAAEAIREASPAEPFLDDDQHGVKRALLESVIRLHCTSAVLADVTSVLGPVPQEQAEAYSWTHELYGMPRMLMAVLQEEELKEVCMGQKCDFWEELAALREVRPVNGGRGFDIDVVMKLRTLNFDLSG